MRVAMDGVPNGAITTDTPARRTVDGDAQEDC